MILSVKEHFMYNTHYVICDTLLTELKKETILTKNYKKEFGFLFKNMDKSENGKMLKQYTGYVFR